VKKASAAGGSTDDHVNNGQVRIIDSEPITFQRVTEIACPVSAIVK
jgi:hypothetical protein